MEQSTPYSGYFRNHAKASFDLDWVRFDSQFVYNQLRVIDKP